MLLVLMACLSALGWALSAQPAQAETLSAGNGIYSFDVNSESGQYTATTGPSHPLGPGLNILFGEGTPSTSFDTVRSYSSHTDYKLPEVGGSTTVPLETSGFQTTYMLEEEGDHLEVVQTLRVKGTTFNDSYAEVTTVVTNNGLSATKIGIRYLWDYQIGLDDGPAFQADEPNGPVLLREESFPQPSFNHYTMEDNDVNPSPPTFDVLGTVTGPAIASPVAPTLLQNASWPESVGTPFEYSTTEREVSSASGEGNDNAVLYYWGDNEGDAPALAPGASYRASASMFLTSPGAGVPGSPSEPSHPAGPAPETAVPPIFSSVPPPRYDQTVDIAPVSGKVLIRLPGFGKFEPLSSAEQIPVGSTIDATDGRLRLTTAKGQSEATETADFYSGEFKVLQAAQGKPTTELDLSGLNLGTCRTGKRGSRRLARSHRKATNGLWGDGHGSYVTKGHAGSATVRGTIWLTEDRCDGTLFKAKRDTVVVRDFTRHRTVILHTGQHYLAPAR